MAIRLFFLLKHYRSPIDFSEERIREAAAALDRLKNAYNRITHVLGKTVGSLRLFDTGSPEPAEVAAVRAGIEEAMDDDFNTARAMGCLFDLARSINALDDSDERVLSSMTAAKEVFDSFGTGVFGLSFETETLSEGIVDDLMNLIIDLRRNARTEKNWALADRIRDRLNEIGIVLEDRQDGTMWKRQ